MRISLPILVVISLFLSHCSKEQKTEGAHDPLVREIWEQFRLAENSSQYSETLDAETSLAQQQNMLVLRAQIPKGYPEPYLPYGSLKNKDLDISLGQKPFLNAEIIALGKKLFFDPNLSYTPEHGFNAGKSCSSCHLESMNFSDGQRLSEGVAGDLTHRNSPTLFNSTYNSTLTWANPAFPLLEMQAKIPLFGDDPIELGLKGKEKDLIEHLLRSDKTYQEAFQKVFGLSYPKDFEEGAIDFTLTTRALAAYERSLIRFDTRFDRFLQQTLRAEESFSPDEREGAKLFYGLKSLKSGDLLNCSRCHAGITMSNSFQYVRDSVYFNRKSFHNTGLYNLDGKGAYPDKNHGFANAAQLAEHPEYMGQFRVPSLRFVASTAPYGHDGSIATLEDLIDHYAAGGRSSSSPKGQNPFTDPLVRNGFQIEAEEKAKLISFLKSLE